MRARPSLVFCLALAACACPALAQTAKPFSLPSPHGGAITGQADLPAKPSATAVLMVAGSNPADRDNRFGNSGTDRDMIFRDLMQRMTARGLATVRYDKRGLAWLEGKRPTPGQPAGDPAVLGTVTDITQADDFAQVYDWARSKAGLGAKCVIVFAHSEGMIHVARAAERGAPAPLAVIGMGPAMADKLSDFRWKATQRDAFSLEMMDADGDGRTTEAEVRAGYARSPSAVNGPAAIAVMLPEPGGAWTADLVNQVRINQTRLFEEGRKEILSHPDAEPWPSAAAPQASYGWWKSWYTDDVPSAKRIAVWPSPMSLHFAELDSQVRASTHGEAARLYLKPEQLRITIHPGKGHSLGAHVAYGPIDPAIADALADEAAEAAKGCR